jgi:hypothetical protein
LSTLVLFITLANFILTAFRVFVETIVGNVTAVFTARFFAFDDVTTRFALDVSFFAAVVTAVVTARTVLRAVGRGVSSLATNAAGLIQECGADNFTIGSGLVFDEVAGIFFFGFSGVTADDAQGLGIGSRVSGIRRRHCCLFFLFD